ncbi:MAG: hypothetical protein BroJett042_00520 [Bacteroidota bacterium]|nr:MAG: hypothetical protein BroJett042_00520 [Bacteroidota bacterium]
MNGYFVKIEKIDWIDKDGKEASIRFSFKDQIANAYSFPCNFLVGEIVEVYLVPLYEETSDESFWKENIDGIKKIDQAEDHEWRYYCYGEIKGVNPYLLNCGVFEFEMAYNKTVDSSIIGKYVYFVIARLDIIEV